MRIADLALAWQASFMAYCKRNTLATMAPALLLGLLSACGSESKASNEGSASDTESAICPSCGVLQAGGESSDFGGTVSPCVLFAQPRAVDLAEAEGLGFEMSNAIARIGRSIDAPLFLRPGVLSGPEPEGGKAIASGYQSETRVEASVEVESWTLVDLDSNRCTDGTCTDTNGSVYDCRIRLEMPITASLSVKDGSLQATGSGLGLYWLNGDGSDFLAGSIRLDLATAAGNLNLSIEPVPEPSPGQPNAPMGSESHSAALLVDFYFLPEGTNGELRIEFTNGTASGLPVRSYYPLQGKWPENFRSSSEQGQAFPEPD